MQLEQLPESSVERAPSSANVWKLAESWLRWHLKREYSRLVQQQLEKKYKKTGKAWSPTLDSHDVGTSRKCDDDDRSRCLDGKSFTLCSWEDIYAGASSWRHWYRQAQQSCIQYAVAPAANGDHAVVVLHDRASSLRIWAMLQHSGLAEVCSTHDQADQQGSHCRSQVETRPMTRPTTGEPGAWQIVGWTGSIEARWSSTTRFWRHESSWRLRSRGRCPSCALSWQTEQCHYQRE